MSILENLLQWNLPPTGQSLLNVILLWLGFAALVGLTARVLVPGRRGRGPWSTLLVGLTGSCLGPLLTTAFFKIDRFNPIGLFGFLASVAAAVTALLLFYLTMAIFPPKPPREEE